MSKSLSSWWPYLQRLLAAISVIKKLTFQKCNCLSIGDCLLFTRWDLGCLLWVHHLSEGFAVYELIFIHLQQVQTSLASCRNRWVVPQWQCLLTQTRHSRYRLNSNVNVYSVIFVFILYIILKLKMKSPYFFKYLCV